MSNSPNPNVLTAEIVQFHCGDRWQIFQRLQELSIPCYCVAEGILLVEVETPLTALLVRSVVMQYSASRYQLLTWLELCWQQ